MKKIIMFILIIVILIALTAGLMLAIPKLGRTYKIEKYNISMKIPYGYKESDEVSENTLANLYNEQNGITINIFDLRDDFWSSGDVVVRADQYLKVISAANYDCGLSVISNEIIQSNKIAKIEVELDKPNSINKVMCVVTGDEIGNMVIEIFGLKENMDNNKKELEKIVQSIKYK